MAASGEAFAKVRFVGAMFVTEPQDPTAVAVAIRRIRSQQKMTQAPKTDATMVVSAQGIRVSDVQGVRDTWSWPDIQACMPYHENKQVFALVTAMRATGLLDYKCSVFKTDSKSFTSNIVSMVNARLGTASSGSPLHASRPAGRPARTPSTASTPGTPAHSFSSVPRLPTMPASQHEHPLRTTALPFASASGVPPAQWHPFQPYDSQPHPSQPYQLQASPVQLYPSQYPITMQGHYPGPQHDPRLLPGPVDPSYPYSPSRAGPPPTQQQQQQRPIAVPDTFEGIMALLCAADRPYTLAPLDDAFLARAFEELQRHYNARHQSAPDPHTRALEMENMQLRAELADALSELRQYRRGSSQA